MREESEHSKGRLKRLKDKEREKDQRQKMRLLLFKYNLHMHLYININQDLFTCWNENIQQIMRVSCIDTQTYCYMYLNDKWMIRLNLDLEVTHISKFSSFHCV